MLVSVVIPVLNEADVIAPLHRSVSQVMVDNKIAYELIFVDDGSTDDTWTKITTLNSDTNGQVIGIRLTRNFGQHAAIGAGLGRATGDRVIVMDGDFQDPPEAIPLLLDVCSDNNPIVFVARTFRPVGRLYAIGQRLMYAGVRLITGLTLDPRFGNFCILSRRVVDSYVDSPEVDKFFQATLLSIGFPITSLEHPHAPRALGSSSYDLTKRIKLAGKLMLRASSRPLTLIVCLGLVVSVLALFGATASLIGGWLGLFSVTGWASLITTMLFLGGISISCIGVVGLYIGRILEQVRGKPAFVVWEETDR